MGLCDGRLGGVCGGLVSGVGEMEALLIECVLEWFCGLRWMKGRLAEGIGDGVGEDC